MVKADNARRIATPDERKIASKLRYVRERTKLWKQTETRLKEIVETWGKDLTLTTSSGDEVISCTESKPVTRYDYAKFFADHPDARAKLEADYKVVGDTRTVITTEWIEPEDPLMPEVPTV